MIKLLSRLTPQRRGADLTMVESLPRGTVAFALLLLVSGAAAQDESRPTVEVPAFFAHQHLRQSPLPPPGVKISSDGQAEAVVLQVTVNPRGRVTDVEPVSGDPELAAAAANAVRKWRYRRFLTVPSVWQTRVGLSFQNGEFTLVIPHVPPASRKRVTFPWRKAPVGLLNRIEPTYPSEARYHRVQGGVNMRVVLGTDGAVRELEVLSGHPMLAVEAMAAVQRWRFTPFEVQGELVEVETELRVRFRLGNVQRGTPQR
jgi:TonB family protein